MISTLIAVAVGLAATAVTFAYWDRIKNWLNMIAEVHLHPKETWEEGKNLIKEIKYAFPVSKEVMDALRENVASVETVVLLSHKKPDGHINVKVEFGEGEGKVPLDNIAKRAESYKLKSE